MSDASHLLSDIFGFVINIMTAKWAARPATEVMSFGFRRLEIVGALATTVLTWLVTVALVVEAINRLQHPETVDGRTMFIVATAGLVVNFIMGFILHQGGHSHGGIAGHGHSHGGSSSHSSPAHHEDHHLPHSHSPHPVNQREEDTTSTIALMELQHQHGVAASDEETGHSHSHSSSHGHDHGHGTPGDHEHHHGCDSVHDKHTPALSSSPSSPHSASRVASSALTPTSATASSHHHNADAAHEHHDNVNIRSAFVHVIGDTVQSVGVMISSAIIWGFPSLQFIDPLCTFLFSILVIFTTVPIVKNCLHVLLESVPPQLGSDRIQSALALLEGVIDVHHLHVWSMNGNQHLMSVHLVADQNSDCQGVLSNALGMMSKRFRAVHATIQVEHMHERELEKKVEEASLSVLEDDGSATQ